MFKKAKLQTKPSNLKPYSVISAAPIDTYQLLKEITIDVSLGVVQKVVGKNNIYYYADTIVKYMGKTSKTVMQVGSGKLVSAKLAVVMVNGEVLGFPALEWEARYEELTELESKIGFYLARTTVGEKLLAMESSGAMFEVNPLVIEDLLRSPSVKLYHKTDEEGLKFDHILRRDLIEV